jgi:DNA modification methylase
MSVRILEGDALTVLRTLPDCSVQCCVTSPPYFGLRDYGVEGQLGLEKTPQLYVDAMVGVFSEVKRVLSDRGVLWLNIGDCYASTAGGYDVTGSRGTSARIGKATQAAVLKGRQRRPPPGLKAKDRIGIPWMLAFALRADGWYLRDEVIWHKSNPMPSSVIDRTTPAHEQLFLLSKKSRYFYDAAAIRTLAKGPTTKMPDGWDTGAGGHGAFHRNGREKGKRTDKQRGHSRVHAGFNGRWDAMSRDEQQSMGANARSVWTIATYPYPEAHFATFPPELAERCVLSGSAKGDTVLDPFSGAGTTALMADRLGRNAIGIELNAEYAEMARRRIHSDNPLFGDVA